MKYKLNLGLGAVFVAMALIGALADRSVAKYDADVRIAEINAKQKAKEETKNKKANNKK